MPTDLDPPLRVQVAALGALQGAFGVAGEVPELVEACLGQDEERAVQAANLLGEWIAHQTTTYPISAPAVTALVALLGRPEVGLRVRRELAEWLEVLWQCAAAVPLEGDPAVLAALAVDHLDAAALELHPRGAWLEREAEGIRQGREVLAAFLAARPSLELLAGDPGIGDLVRAWRGPA
jgi:hypothetical protein